MSAIAQTIKRLTFILYWKDNIQIIFYVAYLRVVFVDVRKLCAILHNAPLEKATSLWPARNNDKKGKRERRGKVFRKVCESRAGRDARALRMKKESGAQRKLCFGAGE